MVQLIVQTQGAAAAAVLPSVGDSVGGGVVFKVVGSKVYVSAEADLSDYEWGCAGVDISGADGTAIGTGEQNTLDIIAGCADTDSAAYMCNNATINSYSDWYLPSKDELSEMYTNRVAIGGFSTYKYWSSSEYDSGYSWNINFNNGSSFFYFKTTA